MILISAIDVLVLTIPAPALGLPVSHGIFDFATVPPLVRFSIIIIIVLISVLIIEKAYSIEFKMLYVTHGLRHYPWWRRRFYLRYALFLRALTDRTPPVSLETITQLRSFADIVGEPPVPESRLLQPAYIVPFIVFVNILITEVLKQAELLKGQIGIVVLSEFILIIVMVFYILYMWHTMTRSRLVRDRTIQRFLQWAEHDIKDVQLLKSRRPHTELPGSPES